jgi:hypothetical protein
VINTKTRSLTHLELGEIQYYHLLATFTFLCVFASLHLSTTYYGKDCRTLYSQANIARTAICTVELGNEVSRRSSMTAE